MSRAAYATIDLAALKHNFSCAKLAAPNAKLMAVIKANAYGHGLLTVAQTLSAADAFAVAHCEEAFSLREAGFKQRIVALQGFADEVELALLLSSGIEPVIHCAEQVNILVSMKLQKPFNVWLKIDTGMNRLGIAAQQFPALWHQLQAIPALKNNVQLMTHFANADDPENISTHAQIQRFNQTVQQIDAIDVIKSLANSAGLLLWQESHADWVRPGIMLYGSSPIMDKSADALNLKPVMTLKSRLIAVNPIALGASVGYGSSWTAQQATKLGIVGIGYGDGYPRHVAAGTPVLINGKRYPIVGRVSMDMICVDLGLNSELQMGDEVVLWGKGLPADFIAQQAGTIAYELFCQVTSRVRLITSNG